MKQYQPNSLFRSGEHSYLNACIGTNGGPYDYGDFSAGYFSASFFMIEAIAKDNASSPTIDICVYPIVANFRHAIELAMKHSIVIASHILRVPADFPTNHKLPSLLDRLQKISDEIKADLIEDKDWQHLTSVIADFSRTDPKGMVFRYPEDLERRLQIDDFGQLNLEVLYEAMKRCKDILDRLDYQLSDIADYSEVWPRSVRHQRF